MSAANNGTRTPEEDMESSTKHRLAYDAEWKVIQKNTFTRWINERLKLVNKQIENIETDLSDGLNLISLLEVLSGKKFQKYTKKPSVRTQKLENVTMALKFLQISEKIKIVNIDSSDIVDHNTKLILGLIWMLILHYAISSPNFDLNNFEEQETLPTRVDLSPKQRLLQWIKNKIIDLEIKNFTSDWIDGRAIGALVDGVAPGLCPNWESWKANDAIQNSREAMTLAEDWLDVPQLIKPEEMCNPRVDEMSVMTYLSQFPNAQLKPGAPLKPRTNRSRLRIFGLKPNDVKVGENVEFTVETFHAGEGELMVELIQPNMNKKQIETVFNNDKYATYTCTYTPEQEGPHQIKVFYDRHEIPKSPFHVEVSGFMERVVRADASGPGLEKSGNLSNVETSFTIRCKNARQGDVDVVITDPNGNQGSIKPTLSRISDDEWQVTYTPLIEGVHLIDVNCSGLQISNSPFSVGIAPSVNLSKWSVSGRGVQTTGLRAGGQARFKIISQDVVEEGELKVEILDGNGMKQMFDLNMVSKSEYECVYCPLKPGTYKISVNYKDKHLGKSPYAVEVKEATKCPVKAYGPGLSGGIVGLPASFCLETNGDSGALAFSIEGPSKAEIDCLDNEDGSALITYHPIHAGEYAVHILCNDEDINDSPFVAHISEPPVEFLDASKVKVSGIETSGKVLTVGNPAYFEVDTRQAGQGHLETSIRDAQGEPIRNLLHRHQDGIHKYEVVPQRPGRHSLLISYGGILIPRCPIKFNVSETSDPTKVLLNGPAMEGEVLTSETTYLLVDCSKAGPGDVAIMLSDSQGKDVPMETEECGVSSFRVIFRPTRPGPIEGKVFFADKQIPLSPFHIDVKPSLDVSKIHMTPIDNQTFLESPKEFIIDTRDVGKKIQNLKAKIASPSGRVEEIPLQDNKDGTYTGVLTLHEEGSNKIMILCDEIPLTEEPHVVIGRAGSDPSQVKVHGLRSGFTNNIQTFQVHTKGAGVGSLNVSMSGPRETKVTSVDNRDGTHTVEYLPVVRGLYEVSVVYGERHVPGSPFKVEIKDATDPTKIIFDDLERIVAKKGHKSKFTIDTRRAGQSDLRVLAVDPQGASKELQVTSNGDGVEDVCFLPFDEGLYSIEVWFGGDKVKTSKVQVYPSFEASKVVLSGAGVGGNVGASMETSFVVDVSRAGEAELMVKIEDHLGSSINHKVSKEGRSLYKVRYRPDDVGHCLVRVFYGGDEVSDSPVRVAVVPSGEALKVQLLGGNDKKVMVGREVRIQLCHSEAGIGRLKCSVENERREEVPVNVMESESQGKSEISYMPMEPGMYSIKIFFGGREVPGGSFQQEALSRNSFEQWENEVAKSQSHKTHSNGVNDEDVSDGINFRQFYFNIPIGPVFGFIKADVTTPSGVTEVPEVINNPDGTITVKYLPNQRGSHMLNITCNGSQVDGYSPHHFQVNSFNSAGKFKASGPGLSTGTSDSMNSFKVTFGDSDFSDMAISIEGPSKVHIDMEDGGDDSLNVRYKPTVPGDYIISILHSHQHIRGSPFTARIFPLLKDLTLAEMSIGSKVTEPMNLGLDASLSDLPKMSCLVTTPMGGKQTAVLRILEGRKLGVVFDAKEAGNYSFEVLKNGLPVKESPIKKFISSTQCSNVDSVKVYGSGLVRPMSKSPNEFFINYKDAGVGGLNLSIDGPGKVDLECVEDKNGICKINFNPYKSGTYVLNVLFSSEHVAGSPFLLVVVGDGEMDSKSVEVESQVVQSYSAISNIGKESLLNLMIPASIKDGLRVFVSGPSGFLDSCYFVPSTSSDMHYSVGFVPKEMGMHLVHVNDGKTPLPGSPFTFIVGPLFSSSGGQNMVRVSGSGLNGGYVGVPGMITIDSRLAGEGNLSITMEGTLKPDINFKDKRDGTCDIVYTCSRSGDYLLSIKFNGKNIKGSPFAILIKSYDQMDDDSIVKKTFNPNEPAFLEVSQSGGKGGLEATVRSPSGAVVLPIIQDNNSGGYLIRFIPREKGLHLVEVTSEGKPLNDSPFKMFVGEMYPDPGKVNCSGSGLSYGRTGEHSEFQISTEGSGYGPLQVSVDGPSQVNLVCRDSFERPLKFFYKPSSPGIYKINVYFAGKAIPSSPFLAEVSGPGKPLPWNEVSNSQVEITPGEEQSYPLNNQHISKDLRSHSNDVTSIVCSGEGLRSAKIRQANVFCVDASALASHQMLSVGVLGPSGPCSEVTISTLAPKKYLVTYQPRETGSHTLTVQWGDVHVQGSPFDVFVS